MNTYIAFANDSGLRVQIQKYDPSTGEFCRFAFVRNLHQAWVSCSVTNRPTGEALVES
jgi:hypothetical protein